jgi:hypothetical protein
MNMTDMDGAWGGEILLFCQYLPCIKAVFPSGLLLTSSYSSPKNLGGKQEMVRGWYLYATMTVQRRYRGMANFESAGRRTSL